MRNRRGRLRFKDHPTAAVSFEGRPQLKDPGNRDIAVLAGVQTLCFVALTQLEPRFLFIHLYQMIPYAAILLFIAYRKERWAYMVGPLVSAAWLGLAYMAGLLDSAVLRLWTPSNNTFEANLVSLLAALTGVIAVTVTLRCRIHWTREFAGQGLARRTFFVSLAAVAGYYAILLHWFWDMIPNA